MHKIERLFILACIAALSALSYNARAQDTHIPGNLYVGGGGAFTGSVTAANFTNSGLTATRVPFAGTGGLLTDSANLTFTGGNTLNTVIAKISSLTITRVPFIGTGGQLLDNANLYYDPGINELYVLAGGITTRQGNFSGDLIFNNREDGNSGKAERITESARVGAVSSNTSIYSLPLATSSAFILASGGDTGGPNTFFDVLIMNSVSSTVSVLHSASTLGTPAARTWGAVGTVLKLAMASGSYDVNVVVFTLANPN